MCGITPLWPLSPELNLVAERIVVVLLGKSNAAPRRLETSLHGLILAAAELNAVALCFQARRRRVSISAFWACENVSNL